MPTPTYDLIASNVLTSSASSVTFSSISGSYRDLVLAIDLRPPASNYSNLRMRFNSDTGANYSFVNMTGTGSATNSSSGGATSVNVTYYGEISASQNLMTISQIMDYSATDKHKTVLNRANHPQGSVEAIAVRWANTSAITSLEVFSTVSAFASGSTFYLYGIVS